MPLVRYEVQCEHSLANPELYRTAAPDDPEGLLEGVAMAGLVGIVRQLGDLAEFAAEIFRDLHDELMAIGGRGHDLTVRVQQLEAELTVVEKALLSEPNQLRFAYSAGAEWHASIRSDQNHCTQGDLPRFVRNFYEDCRGPPRLFLLDKFDVAGVGACLKRYTDPSFFKMEWASTELMKAQRAQQDKKARREKKKGRRRRNGQPISGAQLHTRVRYGLIGLEKLEAFSGSLSQQNVDMPPEHISASAAGGKVKPKGSPSKMWLAEDTPALELGLQAPLKISAKDIEVANMVGRFARLKEMEEGTARSEEEMASEGDHFVDALTTMESEAESDSEVRVLPHVDAYVKRETDKASLLNHSAIKAHVEFHKHIPARGVDLMAQRHTSSFDTPSQVPQLVTERTVEESVHDLVTEPSSVDFVPPVPVTVCEDPLASVDSLAESDNALGQVTTPQGHSNAQMASELAVDEWDSNGHPQDGPPLTSNGVAALGESVVVSVSVPPQHGEDPEFLSSTATSPSSRATGPSTPPQPSSPPLAEGERQLSSLSTASLPTVTTCSVSSSVSSGSAPASPRSPNFSALYSPPLSPVRSSRDLLASPSGDGLASPEGNTLSLRSDLGSPVSPILIPVLSSSPTSPVPPTTPFLPAEWEVSSPAVHVPSTVACSPPPPPVLPVRSESTPLCSSPSKREFAPLPSPTAEVGSNLPTNTPARSESNVPSSPLASSESSFQSSDKGSVEPLPPESIESDLPPTAPIMPDSNLPLSPQTSLDLSFPPTSKAGVQSSTGASPEPYPPPNQPTRPELHLPPGSLASPQLSFQSTSESRVHPSSESSPPPDFLTNPEAHVLPSPTSPELSFQSSSEEMVQLPVQATPESSIRPNAVHPPQKHLPNPPSSPNSNLPPNTPTKPESHPQPSPVFQTPPPSSPVTNLAPKSPVRLESRYPPSLSASSELNLPPNPPLRSDSNSELNAPSSSVTSLDPTLPANRTNPSVRAGFNGPPTAATGLDLNLQATTPVRQDLNRPSTPPVRPELGPDLRPELPLPPIQEPKAEPSIVLAMPKLIMSPHLPTQPEFTLSPSPSPTFRGMPAMDTRDAIMGAIAKHGQKMEPVRRPIAPDGKQVLLEEIRTRSFNLRHMEKVEKTEPSTRPVANINVAAILEKANAIRQACVASDEDDDEEDDWSE